MGKRGRSDSDDDRDRRHSSHKHKKKDKKHKESKHRSRSRSPAAESKPEQDDAAERKRKRLEAWKAMQSTVQKPTENTPAAATAPEEAAPAAPVAVGSFKMGMKAAKPGAFKMAKKAPVMKPALGFGIEDDEQDKPKLGALPPLGRQNSSGGMFSPPASPTPGTPPGMSDLDDDVDPLDAFMTGISKEVKESIGDCLPLSGPSTMRQREQEQEQSKLQTVSMEDIIAGKVGGGPEEMAIDEDVDEDKLEADRQQFMEAIRRDREERAKREQEERERVLAEEEKQRLMAEKKAKQDANTGRFLDDEEEEEYWVDIEEEEQKYLDALHKKKLAKDLPPVDHDSIDYPDFQRAFYMESSDIKKMTDKEVGEYRSEMDQIKIRGKDCPRPIKKWTQCGLPSMVLSTLNKLNYDAPFAIQCQALPAIMSGRDVIGVAKTGSGKTLAFVLPMLRHIKAQPPLMDGDGPIGLIMAPTRELAVQIFAETKRFCKPLNLTPVCAYGGAPMSQQVGDVKAGAEIVVCTPGRAIDLLTLNGGRVMNLQRTTYVVMDEADRMFDMGFEPQVQKIIRNIRPDRQTVMFSATFPKIVEKHAKAILTNPVQIICGGVSVVSNTIQQNIEVVSSEAKLKRLLALLKEWYDLGENILLFVDRQEDADELFRDLIKAGYVALTLHGGKDQNDRDHTLADFKNKDNTLMVATSVAARGLDVKDLSLVVNYACPNHYEDYVHRVGRTGRAGKKGTAYTFIEPEEEQYAPDLVKALELAGNKEIPEELTKLAEGYKNKEKQAYSMGTVLKKSSGFTSGKGYKFDEAEGRAAKDKSLKAKSEAGLEVKGNLYYDSDEERKLPDGVVAPDDPKAVGASILAAAVNPVPVAPVDTEKQVAAAIAAAKTVTEQNAKVAAVMKTLSEPASDQKKERKKRPEEMTVAETLAAAQKAAAQISQQQAASTAGGTDISAQVALAQQMAAKINQQRAIQAQVQAAALQQLGMAMGMGSNMTASGNYSVELEINDYPQQARWKVTHKDSMTSITENYAVCITTRGSYFQPGRNPPPGERKLYLAIEGLDENNVSRAKRELRRMLEEAAAGVREVGTAGRYNV